MLHLDNLFELSRDVLKEQMITLRGIVTKATFMIGFAGTVVAWGIPDMETNAYILETISMVFTYFLLITCILCGLWVLLPRNYSAGDSLRAGIQHAAKNPHNTQQVVTAWVLDSNMKAIEANRPMVRKLSRVLVIGICLLVIAVLLTALLRIIDLL